MRKVIIKTEYIIRWVFIYDDNYWLTPCRKVIDLKNNKILKKVYKNGVIGYYLNKKFYSITDLKKQKLFVEKD